MSEHPTTTNHDFARPEPGSLVDSWGPIINQEFIDLLEARTPLTGDDPATVTPHDGALLFTNGDIHEGDGSNWTAWNIALDGDAQPPEAHGNEAHSADLADLGAAETATARWTFGGGLTLGAEQNMEVDLSGGSAGIVAEVTGSSNFVEFLDGGSLDTTWYYDPTNNISLGVWDQQFGHSPIQVHKDGTVTAAGDINAGEDMTAGGDAVVTTTSSGLEIQKDGVDGAGILNFKTQ